MNLNSVPLPRSSRPVLPRLILAFAAIAVAPSLARAGGSVLYSFQGVSDGAIPNAGLIVDKQGALYGTTIQGGISGVVVEGNGTVFRLTPPAAGKTQWAETVLYSFQGVSDGAIPYAGLISDNQGALYGTTSSGGASVNGSGTVFKLTPPTFVQGAWNKTVLYSFQGGSDGAIPYAGLIFDKQGALYGTTIGGGGIAANGTGTGTVFKLTPPAGKTQWTETVLYRFKNNGGGKDGFRPRAGLIFDTAGALYGTTSNGGASNRGTVFKLTPPATGQTQWSETVLYNFKNDGKDGLTPYAGLIFDKAGALHGTTVLGGASGNGTVFKLTPPVGGQKAWTETVLYSFQGGTKDGAQPVANLIFDEAGALYGTTLSGTALNSGTVFKLTPPAAGKTQWTETVLYSFKGPPQNDGSAPWAGLILDKTGTLYGTTRQGGAFGSSSGGFGTVFKLTGAASVAAVP